MEINWSALDGVLGLILLIVIIWVALKVVTRIVLGGIIILAILALFFGRHMGFINLGF